MNIKNEFSISRGADEVWALLTDIAQVAPCFPGASLTSVDDDNTYAGQVKVKLGPVAVNFIGQMRLVERDDHNNVARATATASDKRGLGGMQAEIEFRLEAQTNKSVVTIDTNIVLTGKVAQYGRGAGMIQRIANKNVETYASNLQALLGEAS